jgi:peptidoglycan/LPS O-acetylase OafA/YrhL
MNRQFPALRGMAIFMVVVNHSIVLSLLAITQFQLPRPPLLERNILLAIKEIGVLAVPTFLFLAGSFMMYSLQDKPLTQAYRLIAPSLLHAIIPYLVWSVVFYIFVYFLRGETSSFTGYMKNILVGYPYNFVPILIAFILISPILAVLTKKYAVWIIGLFVIYQIILLNIQLPGILGFTFPSWMNILSLPILGLPLTLWAVFYPLGMVYIRHSQRIKGVLNHLKWIILTITILLFGLAVAHEIEFISFPLAEWAFPLVAVWNFPLIDRKSIPLVKFLENLGKRSYGIYLLNLTILTLLTQLAGRFLPIIYRIESVMVVLLATITLLFTVSLMGWVEKGPGRKLYRILFG